MQVELVICFSTELEGALLRERLASRANDVALLRTGVGSVNAAHVLTRFLSQHQARQVVVCGIGGAYPGSGLAVEDVVCAETECYGDLGAESPEGFLDMRALGFAVIETDPPLFNELPLSVFPCGARAPFVTVNTCTGTDDAARMMVARTHAKVENMEGAAIAHVARLHGVAAGEVRAISNIAGIRDRSSWRVREAAKAAQTALLAWIESR